MVSTRNGALICKGDLEARANPNRPFTAAGGGGVLLLVLTNLACQMAGREPDHNSQIITMFWGWLMAYAAIREPSTTHHAGQEDRQ